MDMALLTYGMAMTGFIALLLLFATDMGTCRVRGRKASKRIRAQRKQRNQRNQRNRK